MSIGAFIGDVVAEEGRKAASDSATTHVDALRAQLFAAQIAFIDDPFRFKSLLCPRRSGKTYGIAAQLFLAAFKAPNASAAFIAATKTHAKRIIWRDLIALDKKLGLGCKPNRVELTLELPNGSVIALHGAETEHDIDKFRGVAFDLVVFDESASMPGELLDYLMKEVLPYTLVDRLGTLVLSGTPGCVLKGSFYEATSPESQQVKESEGRKRVLARPFGERKHKRFSDVLATWSFHTWTPESNTGLGVNPDTGVTVIWERILADKERQGLHDDDPRWQREGLGRWAADASGLVLRYTEERNGWDPQPNASSAWGLPDGHEWIFAAGVDLGYDDDFDIEVFAFSDTCEQFYHVYGYAEAGLTVTECLANLRRVNAMFGGNLGFVCDPGGLGKQIIAEFAQQGVLVEPAKKTDKRDFIEIWNGDLIAGRCMIIRDSNLARQASVAQWDEKKRGVDKRFADHAIDAALYVRRWALHHFVQQVARATIVGSPEWTAEQRRLEIAHVMVERKRRQLDWWESARSDEPSSLSEYGWDA